MLFKLFWIIRALFYKIFLFKRLGLISYIGSPLFFTGLRRVSVGKRFRLYPHWRIEVFQHGSIEIGEDVSAGQGLHLVALTTELRIGRGTVISTNVLITNSDHDYKKPGIPIYKQPMINKNTRIGDNCFLGAGAKILAGTQLGNQCVVGANAVVKGNFPDFCVIAGNPAKVIKRFDVESQRWINLPD